MRTTLNEPELESIHARLAEAGRRVAAAYPGERPDRQPVHTVYGGAHVFTADVAAKLAAAARLAFEESAPDPGTFAAALGIGGDAALHRLVYARVAARLANDPVEDYRVDYEDGYGHRPDADEDGHAVTGAEQMARGLAAGALPPGIGIRIKPLAGALRGRALRTLDLFLTTLARDAGGRLPPNFVVTLPKITDPAQVTALADALALLESRLGLAPGAVPIELMVETPQSVFAADGTVALPALVAAGRGRVRGAHFGTYDYTAGLGITARFQEPLHPACDFARAVMQVSLAGTGVTLSDGATTVMPVGPHRAAPGGPPLTPAQLADNRAAVHRAWRVHYADVRAALRQGFYQGWDLHPAQLPSRYAAVFAFFLESRVEAAARLRAFVDRAAQATRLGTIFDDAATGQGLLNFFLRGLGCGALGGDEVAATGLTLPELHTRSFAAILDGRRARAAG